MSTEKWWEVDTSATIRVTCKVCGTVRDVAVSTSDTDGQKLLVLEGYCNEHERGSGLGMNGGSDDED